ncbi:dCTP pyrophosphatase 1 [Sceloporus undulatus]|uniref:dCTP pyrophosphatase 1 n=1 Tax=Sceloporus undulatus TaxID=8520 RepID=UPI001C4D7C97|nr:dCTP pyrophosphatase 1 [Sceloporus undulatus]
MASAKRGKEEERYCRDWEEEKDLKDWLRPVVGDKGKAACRFCECEMQANYANLQQHMATTKHQTYAFPGCLGPLDNEGLSDSKNSDTTAAILMKTEASCFSAGSLKTNKEEIDKASVGNGLGNSTESFWFSTEPSLEDIRRLQVEFGVERGWGKYHQPRNLLLALVGEVGELAELFQWREDAPEGLPGWTTSEREALSDELSDVLIYLVALANKCHVDLPSAALRKIEKNRLKYPVEQVYGSSKKYTEYQK